MEDGSKTRDEWELAGKDEIKQEKLEGKGGTDGSKAGEEWGKGGEGRRRLNRGKLGERKKGCVLKRKANSEKEYKYRKRKR